ncbi:low-density lipoprotein receptor-like [Mercenaria mercenaria]|uniref:low-density lipoprotein receptor-like n=1 Tax=Mercenaria mercenaria TaxID=6596 RepID=UPI00234FAC79|nr:low-density lipoprotein receptor-like [Mercenaria mercenaria]
MNAGTVFLFLLGIMRGLSFPTGCAVDEWQCSNGACIQLTSKCDNFPDCSDGSDEQKCTVAPVCLEGLESCPQPNGTTICVEKAVGCGCGLAPDIAHGVISSNSNTIGSSANVTCDAGYETATESILCQDTGIWETAFCSPNDCGPVEKIQYGTIYLSDINNTTFGASGSVVCDEGYETLTPITTCRKNGKWDSVICTRIGNSGLYIHYRYSGICKLRI